MIRSSWVEMAGPAGVSRTKSSWVVVVAAIHVSCEVYGLLSLYQRRMLTAVPSWTLLMPSTSAALKE